MIEACLRSKIISKFLKNYKEKKWNAIIPSLLEISIVYLSNSINKIYYSEKDLSDIIKKLLSNADKNHEFRKKYKFDIGVCFLGKRNSHRNFSKKAKNINELNVYTNYNIDNKIIHYYNRSSEVTPVKRLINISETEGSLQSNKFKKFIQLDKIIKNNNINNNKIMNSKINNKINYNTIDICKNYIDAKIYLSNNNSLFFEKNNNEKEYIKVNKIQKMKKENKCKINQEDLDLNSKNTYTKKLKNEISNKIYKINQNSRIKLLNDIRQEDIFITDFNKSTDKEKSNKITSSNNIFYNKQNNNSINKSSTSMINYPSKKNNSLSKKRKIKIKNICNHINMKKISMKEIRDKQFSNIKKNIINENFSNKNISKDIINDKLRNDSIENIDDINFNSNDRNNNGNITKNKRKAKIFKDNIRNNIINYNSFNSDIYSKHRTFLNDPYFFIKATNKKTIIIK